MAKPIIFRYLFKALCIVCVICMVGYWFYKFNVEDRDIGTVDYTSFKDSSRISYPVASLCFESLDPFSREKILNYTVYVCIQRSREMVEFSYPPKQPNRATLCSSVGIQMHIFHS